jgi:hypothetical protein
MMLRGRFGIIRSQNVLTGKVSGDIGKVPETSERFWTLLKFYR